MVLDLEALCTICEVRVISFRGFATSVIGFEVWSTVTKARLGSYFFSVPRNLVLRLMAPIFRSMGIGSCPGGVIGGLGINK